MAALVACVAAAVVQSALERGAVSGQWATQSFTLKPGWNAVYLEVRPEPDDLESVLAGVPIKSLFTRTSGAFAAQFLQDPSEDLVSDPGWRWYFPPGSPGAVTNTLYSVLPNRAYLIQVDGNEPVPWSVSGRPELAPMRWAPDALTLTGLAVDPAAPPTFAAYFAASGAHAGQPVYRLNNATAAWELADPDATLQSGEAYWVYTSGSSSYAGPIGIGLANASSLDYGEDISELVLKLTNASATSRTLSLRRLPSAAPVSLARWSFVVPGPQSDPNQPSPTAVQWPDLPDPLTLTLAPGQTQTERLAVQRGRFSPGVDTFESVLEITDGAGTRRLLAVSASRPGTAAAARESGWSRFGSRLLRAVRGAAAHPGLWVGHVTVDRVNNAQSGSAALEPVSRPFGFRLIVHVDDSGQARLLQQVIQMWQNGTEGEDGALQEGGNYVLLTDDALIPGFAGATLQDGVPVGRRISSVGYNLVQPQVEMSGSFDFGGALDVTLSVDPNHPTNPFRHRFHPDHDQLDARYDGPAEEVYSYERRITLSFSDRDPELTDPNAPNPPGWGDSLMGGVFHEVIPALYSPDASDPDRVLISGLHRNDVVAGGTFRLTRTSLVAELNPDPR